MENSNMRHQGPTIAHFQSLHTNKASSIWRDSFGSPFMFMGITPQSNEHQEATTGAVLTVKWLCPTPFPTSIFAITSWGQTLVKRTQSLINEIMQQYAVCEIAHCKLWKFNHLHITLYVVIIIILDFSVFYHPSVFIQQIQLLCGFWGYTEADRYAQLGSLTY